MKFGLIKYSFFSGMLAFAGLPIYLHAPKYFLDNYEISLTVIGFTLLGLRCFDFIQDPLIGWVLDIMKLWHGLLVSIMGAIIAFSMIFLFAVPAIGNPLIWFIICMVFLFSSFSVLSILFYSQGVHKAKNLGKKGHIRLAVWRETGGFGWSLLGRYSSCIIYRFWFTGKHDMVFDIFYINCINFCNFNDKRMAYKFITKQ